ncbi:MAG: hypothetical protein A2W77_00700 [Nitrospinae bacterium RIFCSPLOWO2_12_39_16]|nr:MAG: hypothetical protein A2W77_00700 [Nitrospinae bacterium RIFCSPLOWO2_12_39_16]HAB52486.1 hypothetical protein [Ignavibacteriales bacterium]
MDPYKLLEKIVKVFEGLEIPYLVTGSVAAMAYGEPRLTNDIDIVAAVEKRHIRDLLIAFPSDEFYISEEMIRQAIAFQRQFNIIHPASGLKIDVIIKKDTPFDESRFKRGRRIHPAESYHANFSSPEDVIIKKMEFYKEGESEKHLRDITGILKISGDIVDRGYITEWARLLNLTEIWDAVQKRINEKQ